MQNISNVHNTGHKYVSLLKRLNLAIVSVIVYYFEQVFIKRWDCKKRYAAKTVMLFEFN